MATTQTQTLFNKLLKIRSDVKNIKNQFDKDTIVYRAADKKYTNLEKIMNEFSKAGSDRNKTRRNCETEKDLANPSTDHVTIAIAAYDKAQADYKTACGSPSAAIRGWLWSTTSGGSGYIGELEKLDTEYGTYDTSNDSLYTTLDYLKMYVLIISKLKSETIVCTSEEQEWLDRVLRKTFTGPFTKPGPINSITVLAATDVTDFINKFVVAATTDAAATATATALLFTKEESAINPLIITLKSNLSYNAVLAAYQVQEMLLDKEFDKLNLALDELEFISTKNVREPKSLDDAFKSFLAWLKTQPTNDKMDPKHLKYQVTDKLISVEKELGETLVKDYTRDDFLSETRVCGINTTGKDCLHILHQCLSGKTTDDCLKRWNVMDFSGGVNFLEGDKAVAMKLGKKIGLDTNDVKTVCDNFKTSTGKSLAQNVQTVLHSIKAVYTNKPSIPVVIPVWTFVPPLIGGKMVGGGSNVSYADFIRGFDSLKNNIHISGGGNGPNTAIAFRNNYLQLKSILTSNGKTLDTTDDARMDEYINSIERSEKRLDKLRNLIQILKKLYSDPVGKQLLDKDIGTKKVTLELLSDLTEQHKSSTSALTGKISNYFSSYGTLVNSREIQDMLKKHLEDVTDAIKAKSP